MEQKDYTATEIKDYLSNKLIGRNAGSYDFQIEMALKELGLLSEKDEYKLSVAKQAKNISIATVSYCSYVDGKHLTFVQFGEVFVRKDGERNFKSIEVALAEDGFLKSFRKAENAFESLTAEDCTGAVTRISVM